MLIVLDKDLLKMKNIRVSVIIPSYNNGKYLKQCIDSVLSQDYDNLEIVVVDDGSTDNSLKILKNYESKIVLISILHAGASIARNTGILASSGEVIAFLDSDDYWRHDKIRLQIELMFKDNLSLVYSGGIETSFEGKELKVHTPIYSGDCYQYYVKYPTKSIISLPCSSALIRKSNLATSGLFDPTFKDFAEDWDFFRRFSKTGKVGFIDQSLIFYRRHDGNITNANFLTHHKSNLRAVRKMFAEDTRIDFLQQFKVITDVYAQLAKNALKYQWSRLRKF
jgi:glycosyltransferase involved in cell wall biosynthesis